MMPGIGMVLGMLIVLESGEFSRFPTAGDYASYCRTVKSERTSNEKKKGSTHNAPAPQIDPCYIRLNDL